MGSDNNTENVNGSDINKPNPSTLPLPPSPIGETYIPLRDTLNVTVSFPTMDSATFEVRPDLVTVHAFKEMISQKLIGNDNFSNHREFWAGHSLHYNQLILRDECVLWAYGIADSHRPHNFNVVPGSLFPSPLPFHLPLRLATFGVDSVLKVYDHPPVWCIANFLSPEECDYCIKKAGKSMTRSKVVAETAHQSSRTSSSCWLKHEDLPTLMRKSSVVTGLHLENCEPPQVARYCTEEKYDPHHDAFDISTKLGVEEVATQGQRIATILVYLNDIPTNASAKIGSCSASATSTEVSGATSFQRLGLRIVPRKGMALIFFPSFVSNETLDERAIHSGEPIKPFSEYKNAFDMERNQIEKKKRNAVEKHRIEKSLSNATNEKEKEQNSKWIAQVWVRARTPAQQAHFLSLKGWSSR
eukprot:g6119.t1